MQYLAPNIKLERRIVTILLNRPENVETVDIKGEWFQVPNMKALFLAIYLKPRVDDYIEWIRLAKDEGFKGHFSDVQQIHDEFQSDIGLKSLVKSLKHDYLDRLFLDADDAVKKNPTNNNKRKLVELLQASDDMEIDNFSGDIKPTGEEIRKSLYHERPLGIQTRDYHMLNDAFGGGIPSGYLVTLGARAGMGKSAMLCNLAYQMSQKDPELRIDIFTMEMNVEEVFDRLISCWCGADSNWMRDPYHRLDKETKPYIEKIIDKIEASNIHIYDQSSDLDFIQSKMKENAEQLKKGKYIAFVDYIGIMTTKHSEKRYLEIGNITRTFKTIANNYHCVIFELSQLNRSIDNRDDKHPHLSDLKESGSVEQDSNVVIFESENPDSEAIVKKMGHDPSQERIIDVQIAKNRAGKLKMMKYLFNGSKMQLTEIGE